MGLAQPRPKVTFTTRRTATIKNLVPRVNCLIGGTDITKADNADKPLPKTNTFDPEGLSTTKVPTHWAEDTRLKNRWP